MNYEVRVIGDSDLPERHDWALIETPRRTILLVKESALSSASLAEIWAAGRKLRRREPLVPLPRQAIRVAQ